MNKVVYLTESDLKKSFKLIASQLSDPDGFGSALAGDTQAGLLHQGIFSGYSLKILHERASSAHAQHKGER